MCFLSYYNELPVVTSHCLSALINTEHVITVIRQEEIGSNENWKSSFINQTKCECSASILWCLFRCLFTTSAVNSKGGPNGTLLISIYNLFVMHAFLGWYKAHKAKRCHYTSGLLWAEKNQNSGFLCIWFYGTRLTQPQASIFPQLAFPHLGFRRPAVNKFRVSFP